MYYCVNDCGKRKKEYLGEGISLAEVNPETGKIIGERKRIWTGAGGGWIEAPHIYHIGEYYYIIAAEGGTGQGHHEIAGRSKTVWGPYENCPKNPVLTNRNDTSKQISCTGHGDMVEDKNGNWWMVHLGTRPVKGMTHLGREVFLLPVIWEQEWFRVGENNRCTITVEAPLWKEQNKIQEWHADFENEQMEKQWMFRRIPEETSYRREKGVLTLNPAKIKLSDSCGSPTFMAVRPLDMKYCMETEFAFQTKKAGDRAGVVVYLNENFYYRLYKKREKEEDYIICERQMDDMKYIVYRKKAKNGTLKMKLETDGEKYYFSYSIGNKYMAAGEGSVKYLSTDIAGKCFTGDIVGIFAESDAVTTAQMDVYSYRIERIE